MKWDELERILHKMDVETEGVKPNSKNQVLIPCPLAPWFHDSGDDSHPSLSIKVNTAPSLFKCFACKESGKIWSLVESFAGLVKSDELKKLALKLIDSDEPSLDLMLEQAAEGIEEWVYPVEEEKVFNISEAVLRTERFPEVEKCPEAVAYLKNRSIHYFVAKLYDLRYDPSMERIVFPVRDSSNKLTGAVGRTIVDDPKRYHNYFGFEASKNLGGIHYLIDRPNIIVVEGFFDLLNMKYHAGGFADIVCVFKSELSPIQIDLLLRIDKTIYIGFDNDSAGNKGYTKARSHLSRYTYGVKRMLPPPDRDFGGIYDTELIKNIFDWAY